MVGICRQAMTMMMMIMTDPFTTNLVVKGPVAKGSVVKGAHPENIIIIIENIAKIMHAMVEKVSDSFNFYSVCAHWSARKFNSFFVIIIIVIIIVVAVVAHLIIVHIFNMFCLNPC